VRPMRWAGPTTLSIRRPWPRAAGIASRPIRSCASPASAWGPARSRTNACLVVRVGTAEVGFAFPRKKLKEFAQWMAAQDLPEK